MITINNMDYYLDLKNNQYIIIDYLRGHTTEEFAEKRIKNKEKMKKYLVLKPMATTIKKLLINGDIIYAEKRGWLYDVYDAKTRDFIGRLENINNLEEK